MILTPRQVQVAALLAKGLGTTEVAEVLGISFDTTCVHVRAIAAKLPNPQHLTPLRLARQWAILNSARFDHAESAP